MSEISKAIYETSKRRTVYANVEAKRLGVSVSEAQKAIQELRRARLVYQSDPAKRNYFGSSFAGYRAN